MATLDVRHVWKGTVSDRVVVPSGDGASCVYVFEAGRRYLVFAYHDPSNGRVRVSLCSATHEWDGTGSDAEFLASLSRPAAGGDIFGTVRHFTRAGGGVPEKDQRPVVTSVHLQTPAGVRTVTSNGGEYRFDGLTPGAYSLTLDTPPGDIAYPPSARLEIPASRACASQPFSLTDNGRIAGRVVNSKGVPPVGLSVEVVTAGNIPLPRDLSPRTVRTADDRIVRGRRVAIRRLRRRPQPDRPADSGHAVQPPLVLAGSVETRRS